jgi:hypothetical protein
VKWRFPMCPLVTSLTGSHDSYSGEPNDG